MIIFCIHFIKNKIKIQEVASVVHKSEIFRYLGATASLNKNKKNIIQSFVKD
jgi:hypothetical protein